MISTFLVLHTKQTGRLFRELGIVRGLIILLLLAITLARIYTLEPPYTYVTAALLFFLLLSVHVFREDQTFLAILGIRKHLLYLVEYHLLVSPFYLIFLLNGRWIETVSIGAAVSLIPFIHLRLTRQVSVAHRLPFVFSEAFEWKSGLRKQSWIIMPLYILALGLYSYPFVALLTIVVFTFIVTTFYNESEPRPMVEAFAASPSAFLFKKGKIQLMLFWIGCTPLVLIFLLTNATYWYVLLVWIIVCSVIQLLSINLKYSLYEPNVSLNKDVLMAIYFLSLFVPFFFPVPLVMMIHYYRRARKNLKPYLHDSP